MSATAAAVVLTLAACSGKAAATRDTSGPIVAAPVDSGPDCPATGLWARCSVLKGLSRAGLAVRPESITAVRRPPLAIEGFRLPIARGEIEVFLYADSASRRRDEAKLDTTEYIPPWKTPGIRQERTEIGSANLLVLMNVLNETNRERIANAMLAGAPQPPSRKP
jgi:hypothetical protein